MEEVAMEKLEKKQETKKQETQAEKVGESSESLLSETEIAFENPPKYERREVFFDSKGQQKYRFIYKGRVQEPQKEISVSPPVAAVGPLGERLLPLSRYRKKGMRLLVAHKEDLTKDSLEVFSTDERGSGGAYHRYEIYGFAPTHNPSYEEIEVPLSREESLPILVLLFQQGPRQASVNGITQEVLLAIVADRLSCFQQGPFASPENEKALFHVQQALALLHERTKERRLRGVEGKSIS